MTFLPPPLTCGNSLIKIKHRYWQNIWKGNLVWRGWMGIKGQGGVGSFYTLQKLKTVWSIILVYRLDLRKQGRVSITEVIKALEANNCANMAQNFSSYPRGRIPIFPAHHITH